MPACASASPAQTTVYIVPRWKRRRRQRAAQPEAAAIGRRMEAAVDEKTREIEVDIGEMIDRMANEWGFITNRRSDRQCQT